jgi:hypothetical protein
MNLLLLVEEIKKFKSRDQKCAFYVDLKSAYNTIDRDLLYEILTTK